jgi:hypothetical protein
MTTISLETFHYYGTRAGQSMRDADGVAMGSRSDRWGHGPYVRMPLAQQRPTIQMSQARYKPSLDGSTAYMFAASGKGGSGDENQFDSNST